MAEPLRRTWPQRLTFLFALLAALGCFVAAGTLAFGQWVLSSRGLVAVAGSTEDFQPDAASTAVIMPGDATTTTLPVGEGGSATTTTIQLAEPDAANFLVTGSDFGVCPDQDAGTIGSRGDVGERSDTIMVWRVNPDTNQLAVLSFPRDLYVELPGGGKGRINGAYRRNDPSRLVDTLQRNFGVPIDHYIQLDFCAFRTLVDAVGGVEVPFEFPAQDRRSGLVVPEAGCVNLDGDMALAYVRSRYYRYEDPPGSGNWKQDGTSDFGRIARQQDFMRRVISKVVNEGLYDPDVAMALITTNRDHLVTDANLTPRRMLEFAATLRSLDPAEITTYRIESTGLRVGDAAVQRPLIDNDNMRAILAVFRGEATLASAPEQPISVTEGNDASTTTQPSTTTTSTTVPTTVESAAGTTVPDASATTVPAVAAEENVLGYAPPRDLTC